MPGIKENGGCTKVPLFAPTVLFLHEWQAFPDLYTPSSVRRSLARERLTGTSSSVALPT
jgi:hypothetical protein